jgi:lipoic acid synthetase
VDRDELPDGGAHHFARVIEAVHELNPGCAVEVLTPDFKGVGEALGIVLAARPEVFSHNMETVRRLYRTARPGSRYENSLALLRGAADARESLARRRSTRDTVWIGEGNGGGIRTGAQGEAATEPAGKMIPPAGTGFRVKTGLMVGLGETDDELREAFRDIRAAGVDVLTLGQYLQPTKDHLPVDRFVTPDEFATLRGYALTLGFLHVEAGPLVRSSYHAHEHRPDPQPLHRS